MSTLKMNTAATKLLGTVAGIDRGTGFQATTLLYMLKLASAHPREVTFEELSDSIGLSPSQISRVTRGLHKKDAQGRPGAGLVDVSFDIDNPRTKTVCLSAKGLEMMQRELAPY